jgi:hypothetical protein
MTVAEMLERVSSRELTEWAAYEQLAGPLDQGRRVDAGTGIVSATIANAMRSKKGRRYKPADFAPNWGSGQRPTQTWQQQLAMVEQINRALGGKDRRRRRA